MSIEDKIEKRILPDSNRKLTGMQVLFWWFCILIPFMIFAVVSGWQILYYFTSDNNSYSISNIGSGILTGLASVCFSYYKLLDNGKYIQLHKDIQRSGEFFLISAIAFLISSALKFSWNTLGPEGSSLLRIIIRVIFSYTFFVAEVIGMAGLIKMIDVLFRRVTNSNPSIQVPTPERAGEFKA